MAIVRTLMLSVAFLGLGIMAAPQAPAQETPRAPAKSQPQSAASPNAESVEAKGEESVEQLIVRLANRFRSEQMLSALEPQKQLNKTALEFAEFMARTGEYGHQADGRTPSERVAEAGYEYCIVAENIAWRMKSDSFSVQELANGFQTGWEESPEHRENLVNPAVTQIGLAVAQNEETGRYYAVQLFGLPRSAQIVFKIRNQSEQTATYQLADKMFELPPRYTRTHKVCEQPQLSFSVKVDEGSEKPATAAKTFEPKNGEMLVLNESEKSDVPFEVARQKFTDNETSEPAKADGKDEG